MALRNIVIEGDEILTKRSKEVTEINDRILMILDDMLETMRENNGLGIAAPQVGILRRMFIVEVEDQLIEMINPEIIEVNGVQQGEEGCLSVPGLVGTVERPEYVKMSGLNRKGEKVEIEGSGLLAVALSHEFDHLEGVLFTEKATEIRDAIEESEE
ncbi:MAG: peptide deformylase [Clostridiales bacterium]|jgi:peptide deformylase|nr:peptide deformylase [Clostridiales bacterium]